MTPDLPAVDRELLTHLSRLGRATVPELCVEMAVTATAVRQKLERLHSQALVEKQSVRVGRGRPHYVYTVTAVGQRMLGDNYADLAQILWRELQHIENAEVRDSVLRRIELALVQRYRADVDADSPSDRLKQLQGSLQRRGFHVEYDDSGQLPILRENHCPYIDLATKDASICDLEQQVFEQVVGTSLELKKCCLEGHTCCEFEMADA